MAPAFNLAASFQWQASREHQHSGPGFLGDLLAHQGLAWF